MDVRHVYFKVLDISKYKLKNEFSKLLALNTLLKSDSMVSYSCDVNSVCELKRVFFVLLLLVRSSC